MGEIVDLNGLDNQTMSEASKALLPTLFKRVETLHSSTKNKDGEMEIDNENEEDEKKNQSKEAQRVMDVTDAIAALAPLAPKKFLQGRFSKIMKQLLKEMGSKDDETENMCIRLGLTQALVKSKALDIDSIALLYKVIQPLVKSDAHNSRVQKRAYKVMAEICEHYTPFVTDPE